jgi:hypothetical protein
MDRTKKEIMASNKYLKEENKKLLKEIEKLNNYQRGLKDALYYMGAKK